MNRNSFRDALFAIGNKMSFPIKLVIVLTAVPLLVAAATSVTLSDGEWIGLGSSAGRLQVDDLATDVVSIEDAEFIVTDGVAKIGQDDAQYGLLQLYGDGASSYFGGRVQLFGPADWDGTRDSYVIDTSLNDLRFFPADAAWNHRFKSDGDVWFAAGLEADGYAIFNESGADVDFRVEGDTAANLLFVDAGDDQIELGGNVLVEDDSTIGIGTADVRFAFRDVGSYDKLEIEDAELYVDQGAHFNRDAGSDVTNDFQIEGDTDPYVFYVDASTNSIAIGNFLPEYNLDVIGTTRLYGDTVTQGGDVNINSAGNISNEFIVSAYQNPNALHVNGIGQVSIGTNSPTASLHISGTLEVIDDANFTQDVSIDDDLVVDGSFTSAGFTIFSSNLRLALSPITLSSNSFNFTSPFHKLAPESGTTDDLDSVGNGGNGDIVILTTYSTYVITVKDGTGNLNTAGDFAMSVGDTMTLIYNDGTWLEVTRSNN